MERSLHRFVRLLRLRGVRVSVTEALDAMHAAATHGALADRETLRCVLRVALVKDRRDEELFDELFDRYFRLEPVAAAEQQGHNHAHDDLADTGTAESFTISPEASQTPQQGHSHGKPADIRDFFRQQDLATAYNLHQEANKIDLASMTDEIVLSKERGRTRLLRPSRPAGYVPAARRGPAGQAAEQPGDQARRRPDGGRGAGPARLARRSGRRRTGGRGRGPGARVRRRDRQPQRAAQAPPGGTRGHGPPGHRVPGAVRRPHARGRRGRTSASSRRPCAAWPRPCREP